VSCRFGVVLIELIARKSPPMRGPATCFDFRPEDVEAFFPADCTVHTLSALSAVVRGPGLSHITNVIACDSGPALLKELTIKCIKYSPADRPSFKEVRPVHYREHCPRAASLVRAVAHLAARDRHS
jgi:hypothetical protein